jgi:hypothetical protein
MLPRTEMSKKAKVDGQEHGLKAEDIGVHSSHPMIASAAITTCLAWPGASLAVSHIKFIRKRWLLFQIAATWLCEVLELELLLIQWTLYTEVAVMAPP